jgi:hypothetical protein
MLVVTGRAAAAAQGQEVLPFTPPELQQVRLWTTWYYHNTLVNVAAMQVRRGCATGRWSLCVHWTAVCSTRHGLIVYAALLSFSCQQLLWPVLTRVV